jgi:hypothetical protein
MAEPIKTAAPKLDPFSEDGKEAIRAAAKRKVAEEIRKAEEDRLLLEMLDEERAAAGLTPAEAVEDEVDIMIDLAEFTDRIIINGKPYLQGRSYRVKRSVAESLRDIMFCGHKSKAMEEGKQFDVFKSRGASISGQGAVVQGVKF